MFNKSGQSSRGAQVSQGTKGCAEEPACMSQDEKNSAEESKAKQLPGCWSITFIVVSMVFTPLVFSDLRGDHLQIKRKNKNQRGFKGSSFQLCTM